MGYFCSYDFIPPPTIVLCISSGIQVSHQMKNKLYLLELKVNAGVHQLQLAGVS